MISFKEFLSELQTDLRSFADSGDIDSLTVKRNLIFELRKFGKNICVLNEEVLDISNSQARLPQDFKSLKMAVKIDPIGCNGDRNKTNAYIYKEYISNPAYFDEVNQEYVTTCNPKIITETITLNDNPFTFYYNNIQWLSLTKGINKNSLSADCLNLNPSIRNAYPFQISINQSTLNTNFSTGTVYIQYYGLPVDEDGDPLIPEMTTNDLYDYLMNVCKCSIAEDLIVNSKNPQGLAQILPLWQQKQRELKRAALVESAFYALSPDWHKKLKAQNKRYFYTPSINII